MTYRPRLKLGAGIKLGPRCRGAASAVGGASARNVVRHVDASSVAHQRMPATR